MIIRLEKRGDENAIFELTQEAFKNMPFSNGSEGPIINQLRQDGDLTLSLVAVENDCIVGHIAFSPVSIDSVEDGWFGLGPVSVNPNLQRQGIGGKLINEGLLRIKAEGAEGCALIGDPGYYSRFRFKSDGKLIYGDTPFPIVQWTSFGQQQASGELKFAPAFAQDYE